MRPVLALVSVIALAACGGPTPAPRARVEPAPPDAPIEYLLASAADDFKTHRPPFPDRLRDVRVGYVVKPGGVNQYLLCGSFLPESEGAEPEWQTFATIKTSGYEQYLGGPSISFCEVPTIVWITEDLSASLQSRLE